MIGERGLVGEPGPPPVIPDNFKQPGQKGEPGPAGPNGLSGFPGAKGNSGLPGILFWKTAVFSLII